jgi:hypothetical protein
VLEDDSDDNGAAPEEGPVAEGPTDNTNDTAAPEEGNDG